MKTVLLIIGVVVLMAASGGVGYYFGNDNGLKSATNIRAEFFANRGGGQGGFDPNAAAGQRNGTNNSQGSGQQRSAQGNGGQGAQGGFASLFSGRPSANGSVKGVQGNTITVTEANGNSATVTVDDKTTIQKFTTGTIADIQPGLNIIVTEQNNLKRVLLLPAQ